MIFFPPLRLRRATIQLRELTIAESIGLASIAPDKEQSTVSYLLSKTIENIKGIVEDPELLTVQERLYITTHYLSCVAEDGPNFTVAQYYETEDTEKREIKYAKYADYFDGENDITEPATDLGELEGDHWTMGHLLGGDAAAIERVTGALENIKDRFHWLLGAMACQLTRKGEDKPKIYDAELDDWLVTRMKVLSAFNEGDFLALVSLWQQGQDKLHHLFRVELDESGVLVMPKEVGSALPPARFRAVSCVSDFAQRMAGWAF